MATSPPDGLTLLVASSSLAASSALSRDPGYDPLVDLEPVSMVIDSPSLFVVPAAVPVNTVGEFIALAKSKPGELNYGSTGVGSGPHLAMELFKSLTGTDMVHVPYNGEAPMYSGLFSNEIQASVLAPQSGLNQVRAGRLKALAVTAIERSALSPDIPSMTEAGVPGYQYKPWIGIFAPGGTPAEIVQKINADSITVLNDETIKTKFLPQWGSEATPGTAKAFKDRYLSDISTYKKVIEDAKIPRNE